MNRRILLAMVGIGTAVPVMAASPPSVHAETFVVGSLAPTGENTLAAKAALAATNGTADTITFADGLTGTVVLDATITLDTGDSIVGPGPTSLTVSGDDLIRPISFTDAGTVSISGITIADGAAVDGGCLSATNTAVVLDNVYVQSCLASGDGGGIHILGGSLTGTGLYVASNSADNDGGGVWARDASVTISTSTLTNNTAGSDGGGLMAYSAPALTGVMVMSNTASAGHGGGVNVSDGEGMAMRRCTVGGNSAFLSGGGLYVGNMLSNGSGLIASSLFEGNTAGQGAGNGLGGGIALDLFDETVSDGTFTVVNTTVTGNQADFYGGVVAMTAITTEAVIAFDTIVDNTAGDPSGEQLGVFMPGSINHSVVAGDGDALDASVSVGVQRSLVGDQTVTFPGGGFVLDAWSTDHLGDAHGLGVLRANGGPTWTMKPTAGSVLVNGGATSLAGAPAFDARGLSRRQGGRYDIGAVEWQVPSAPRNITAAARPDAVRIGWSVPATRGDGLVLGYRIYRQGLDGSWTRVGTVGTAARSFVVAGLVTGRLYRFKVVAVNAGGAGPASSVIGKRAG